MPRGLPRISSPRATGPEGLDDVRAFGDVVLPAAARIPPMTAAICSSARTASWTCRRRSGRRTRYERRMVGPWDAQSGLLRRAVWLVVEAGCHRRQRCGAAGPGPGLAQDEGQ